MKHQRHTVSIVGRADSPRSIFRIAVVILLFLLPCDAGMADIYYVGPSATGNGSGSSRSDLKALNSFKASAQPGDIALLQPGDYGRFDIDGGYGSAAGGDVVYRADPDTCTERASNWWTDEIPRLTANNSPVFTGIRFGDRESGGAARGHYVTLDRLTLLCAPGEWSTAFAFRWPGHLGYVAHITIRNCSVWGAYIDKARAREYLSWDCTAYGFYFHNSPDLHDILIDGLYMDLIRGPVDMIGANVTGPFEFRDCHISYSTNGLRIWKNAIEPVVFRRCHIGGSPNPTMGDTGQRRPDFALRIQAVGVPSKTTFTYDDTAHGDPPDIISDGHDYVRVTHGGTQEVRQILTINKKTNQVVVNSPFSFNLASKDTVEFFEQEHGSLFSLHGGSITLDGCILHDMGNSGFVYTYSEPGCPHTGITIENCLMYDARWNANFILELGHLSGGVGNNITIRNNTIFGQVRDGGQTTGPGWDTNYGRAIRLALAPGTNPDTVRITNNIFGGVAVVQGSHVRNNYVFAGSGFETDTQGPNRNNVIVSAGGDRTPFNSGWFVGGANFADTFKYGNHHRTFINEFKLLPEAPGVGAGSNAPGDYPPFDREGHPRTGVPDVGCYAYQGAAGNRPPVLQPVGNRVVAVDQPLSLTLVATDPEGDPVTFSASGMPAGASLAGSTFTWRPTAGQIGNHPVTFTASDGQTQDSETITISVERPNAAPILSGITDKTVNENQALAFSVNATDADGDPLTYAATGLPNGATFTGRTFNWTPAYDQAGAYHVTFTASDGRVQDSRTVAISVANVNRPPALAGIGDRSTYESNPLAFSLLAADPDGAGLTYSATGLPAGAKLAGQNFSWTPTSGQIGSHEVTFLVSDGTLTDSETITITVTGVAADHIAPVVTQQSPAPGAIQVPLNNLVTLHVADAGRGVDPRSVRIAVDGKLVYQGDTALYTGPYGRCTRSGAGHDYEFIYQPDQMFDFDHEVAVTVNATDLGGNVMHERAYSFATEMRAFGSIKRASAVPLPGKECPVTVSDGSGNIWVAWHSGKPGARDILVAVQPVGQQRFQVERQITWDSDDQCYPDLALGSNGAVYVVWQDNRRGHWDIYASVCSDGQTFSPNILVTDFEGNQIDPTLVVHPGAPDRVSVAWQDDRHGNQDICVASSTNAFATVAVTEVTTNAADQTQPDMAAGGANTIYLVWTDGRNGHADIYGAASTNAWANIPIVAGAGDQTSPAVVTPSNGATLHLVWMDNRAGNTDIYYASSNGLPTSPLAGVNIVDDTSGAEQRAPAIACADNGKVFACWEDLRNMGVYGNDLDVYFVELSSAAAQTNILVGDTGGRANQSWPAVAVSVHDQPYMVWVDDRTRAGEIQCAGTTLIDPAPLHAAVVAAATGATIGANPAAITQTEHVSLVVPPGAAPDNVRITISEIHNPVVSPGDCLGSYDFGPSGIHFAQPVTVTIPYRLGSTSRSARAYWYNSLTGAMSQQGITRIENIRISGDLYALRFQTTHFTPFYLLADDAEAASSSGGGGGGGCSMSVTGDESPGQLLVPCGLVAVAMMILRRRDRKHALARSE